VYLQLYCFEDGNEIGATLCRHVFYSGPVASKTREFKSQVILFCKTNIS